MTIKTRARNAIATGLVALTGLLPMNGKAGLDGNIGYLQSEHNENSYTEMNVFYKLPGDIKGFTFLDFYNNSGGFFGKTTLNRPILKGIGPRLEVTHVNEAATEARLGLNANIPGMPKGTYAGVKVLPLCTDGNRVLDDKIMAGFCAGAKLPYGFTLDAFGEWNVAAEGGPQWGYGEIELARKLTDRVKLGYNAALCNDGDASPKVEHRVALRVDF